MTLTSCGYRSAGDSLAGLTITLTPSTAFIFTDESATGVSCLDYIQGTGGRSVSSPRIRFSEVTLKWDGQGTLEVLAVSFLFSGTNISAQNTKQSLSPDELACVFAGSSAILTTGQSLTSTSSAQGRLLGLNIGGLPLTDKEKYTYISGTFRIVGILTEPGKDPVQVRADKVFYAEGNTF